jgi:sporulation protein YunB
VALPPAGPWEKFVAAVVALLVVAGVALFFLDILFWPALRTLAQAELKNLAVEIMYEAVRREMAETEMDYQSLFRVETNDEGVVTLLQPNTFAVNDLAARSALAIKDSIRVLEGRKILIPLGRALGSRLLGGVGPRIPVTIYPMFIEDVTIWDTFEAAGINQTRHRIYLNIKLNSRTAIPFIETEVSVEADFPVAEAVIVGPVPRTYLGGGYLPIFPRIGDGD